MRLTAYNPSTDNLEKTYLAADYALGQTSIVTKNTDNISANDRLLIGQMGREKSEIVTVQSVSADKITIVLTAGTKFPHSADDPVFVLRYDTIRFYRSVSGVDGSYPFLVSVPIDVDNKEKLTYYNDNTGVSSYYYEISFYHSIAAIESALSDPMPGEGYARDQVGSIVNDFLEEVDDLEQNYVTIPKILSWFNEVNDDLFSQTKRPYKFLRRNPPWTLSTTTGNNRITLPSDLTYIDMIQYKYDSSIWENTRTVEVVSLEQITNLIDVNDNLGAVDDDVQFVAIDETTRELVIYPTPYTSQTNVFTIYGWTSFSQITDLSDIIQTPTPRVYKLFLLSRFWRKRSVKENSFRSLADDYLRDYNTEIIKLQRTNKTDLGSPQGMVPDMRSRGYYGNKYR